MQGDFCSQCGQSATDYNVPVTEFAREFANEAFSLDSRLRLTLKPLFFEPGAVPRDYVAGHRARFVPPSLRKTSRCPSRAVCTNTAGSHTPGKPVT